MKRIVYVFALAIWLIAACAPYAMATPVPATTATPVEPIYFSLIGPTDKAYHNEPYYSQRLVTGTFSAIGLDCSTGMLAADQKLMLLSSIEWLAVRSDVQDIIDPPGRSSYTTFIIPGDGRDPDLGFTLPEPRLNAIEVISSSMTTGPCGFIVAKGWQYEDVADLYLASYGTRQRHDKASLEGEFLINPAYIQGELITSSTTYSGKNWPTSKVDQNLLIFEGGLPESVICNGVEQPGWSFVNKLRESWDVDLDDSQVYSPYIHRRTIGDTIPMWGSTYPPEFNATILGAGWAYDVGRYHAYIILGLPEGCR